MKDIINIDKTISRELLRDKDNLWEVLPEINNYIMKVVDKSGYTEIDSNVWVGENVIIDKLSTIIGPCIIGSSTEVRPGAYIRGNAIIGKNCIIGNSTEIKNSIICDNCQLSHYNYVGDSILGYNVRLGAGVILSNLKINNREKTKIGSIIGDDAMIGCNSVLYPGTIVGKNTNIYPLVRVRGLIASNSIMKDENLVIEKE